MTRSIGPELEEVMRFILKALDELEQLWAFTGSLGMALQGVPLRIGDIDIQTNRDGSYAIQNILKEFCISPVRYLASSNMRSYLGTFHIGGYTVEVMGDIDKKLGDGSWTGTPDLSSIIHFVGFKSLSVPVLDLYYEKDAYRIMGRVETAAILERFLQKRQTESRAST